MHNGDFKILTIGWDPPFVDLFLTPIAQRTGIDFTHAIVGDASRVAYVERQYPGAKFIPLSKRRDEPLPSPDYDLLRRLEQEGIPTVRGMVQGDRVLRYRSEKEAFGYATLLALRIRKALDELRPDVVLASFDSMHSAMSLAVARSAGIPWVALAFPVIPENLTGFCRGLTPDTLLPLSRPVDEPLRETARALIANVRSRKQHVVAYRAPVSLAQWAREYVRYGKNFMRRKENAAVFGIDRFTYPSTGERVADVLRRSLNRLRLPLRKMLTAPPAAPFLYYPFHMAPESMLDTWAAFYQNQLGFVAQLALAVPADVEFVVKLHFSDPDNYSRRQLLNVMSLPRVRIAAPTAPGRDFLDKAVLVVGIQGTSCLEAALLGKPVLIFGDSPYQHFPRTERALRPDELHGQIQRMLARSAPSDEEIVEAYAAYMARYMPGRVNDWNRRVDDDDLAKWAECFRALRSYVEAPGNRARWYEEAPCSNAADLVH